MDYFTHLSNIQKPTDLIFEYNSRVKLFDLELKPLLENISKSSKILEIGSGFGYLSKYLLNQNFSDVSILDSSAQLLDFAEQLCDEKLSAKYNVDACRYFENTNIKYDCIIMFDVIEHFNKNLLIDLLRKIGKSLNKNGKFIFRTPNMSCPMGLFSRYIDITHEVGFTEFNLEQLLRNSNFKNIFFLPDIRYHQLKGLDKFKFSLIRKFVLDIYRLDGRTIPTRLDKNLIGYASK